MRRASAGLKASSREGPEIVHYQDGLVRLSIANVNQLLDLKGPLDSCSVSGHRDMSATREGLIEHKDMGDSIVLVFVIIFELLARFVRGSARGTPWRIVCLSRPCNQWRTRIIQAVVKCENVLHRPNKCRNCSWVGCPIASTARALTGVF